MKTVEELKASEAVYLNDWKEKADVVGDFEEIWMNGEDYRAEKAPYSNVTLWEEKKVEMCSALERYAEVNILLASYGCANYEGDAFVLFERDGKLYEVNGDHCSCYGLEGQWDEEETTVEDLAHRLEEVTLGKDSYSYNEFYAELCELLGV